MYFAHFISLKGLKEAEKINSKVATHKNLETRLASCSLHKKVNINFNQFSHGRLDMY